MQHAFGCHLGSNLGRTKRFGLNLDDSHTAPQWPNQLDCGQMFDQNIYSAIRCALVATPLHAGTVETCAMEMGAGESSDKLARLAIAESADLVNRYMEIG